MVLVIHGWGYRMWTIILFFIMMCMLIVVIYFYRKRERNLIKRLQIMIDCAADGAYEISEIDESTLSALENSMNRFLGDCEVSYRNLSVQKEKTQTLISDISHQTITPISNILLYAQLLEEKDFEKVYNEEITAIKEQTEKLNFLINSLVKISRLETGIIAVNPKINKVQEVIDLVMMQSRTKAKEKNIMITAVPCDVEAVFDLKWTVEAIYNIVDNAVKYTPPGGQVTIHTVPFSFFLKIDIADNGIGITESEYTKIFGRFYRSQAVSEVDGVGIGLYLARQIISIQGGYIKVSSKEKAGSIFSVFLPLQECIKTVTL